MNFKRKRTKRQRAGCKLCKPHKQNGVDDPTLQELKARIGIEEQLDEDWEPDCSCDCCMGCCDCCPGNKPSGDLVAYSDGVVETSLGAVMKRAA